MVTLTIYGGGARCCAGATVTVTLTRATSRQHRTDVTVTTTASRPETRSDSLLDACIDTSTARHELKLATHYTCPKAVLTGVKNDTRVNLRAGWSPVRPTRPVITGVKNDTTAREYGRHFGHPFSRAV